MNSLVKYGSVGAFACLAGSVFAQAADPFADVVAALTDEGITVSNYTAMIVGLLGFFAVGLAVMIVRRALKRNTSAG